ncbi:MAG TPA: CPBP family intramembrane metalloprotease [Metalysinibacillus jejuensis]|uniref:CPBP family intramembrane metalloprotease n=1 Tax=Metalysinibacillus jejuensis TaxID=914327 RepID=A0A921NBJ2_9BACL|nr:type II CAAX endopeptidase family protein [Metalysinibacillus jejuensis]HJH11487.1 CPBP family intramembrane metalloprotease [Metalysinibacillus jejuensis]
MQITNKQKGTLVFSLLFMFIMLYITFDNKAVFWYLYTFTILVSLAIAILHAKFYDELPTWHYLLFGIGYGTVSYGIIRACYELAPIFSFKVAKPIARFLQDFAPAHIGHYVLLIFIIIIGEELFWRGYVQQLLKGMMKTSLAVVVTALLSAMVLLPSGFIPGMLAAFVVSILWGFLYEWKRSMPLIIITHMVFILLLFLVLPLQ